MITVHHLNASRSQRVLWLLEELEVPYEIVRYERDPKTLLAPKSLEAIHPLGKSPVIVDDGKTIAESGAILEYLVEKYGNGRLAPKPNTQEAIDYRYFMHYAEGSLMPFLLLQLVFHKVATNAPLFVRPIAGQISKQVGNLFVTPNLKRHLAFIAAHLAKQPWFAGSELTAADIQMSYPVEAAVTRAKSFGGAAPSLASFVERCHARPAFQRALERGGPYFVE